MAVRRSTTTVIVLSNTLIFFLYRVQGNSIGGNNKEAWTYCTYVHAMQRRPCHYCCNVIKLFQNIVFKQVYKAIIILPLMGGSQADNWYSGY